MLPSKPSLRERPKSDLYIYYEMQVGTDRSVVFFNLHSKAKRPCNATDDSSKYASWLYTMEDKTQSKSGPDKSGYGWWGTGIVTGLLVWSSRTEPNGTLKTPKFYSK